MTRDALLRKNWAGNGLKIENRVNSGSGNFFRRRERAEARVDFSRFSWRAFPFSGRTNSEAATGLYLARLRSKNELIVTLSKPLSVGKHGYRFSSERGEERREEKNCLLPAIENNSEALVGFSGNICETMNARRDSSAYSRHVKSRGELELEGTRQFDGDRYEGELKWSFVKFFVGLFAMLVSWNFFIPGISENIFSFLIPI